jgi:tetratricopeptide (TPR) repeat protein
MGHYLTVEGYDDAAQILYGMDTNLGPGADGRGRPFAYDELGTRWRQFNRVFIVVYPTEREAELAAVLGNYRDESWAIHAALNTAKVEASSYPNNPYAWFNLGSSFAMLQDYQNAAIAFDKARTIGTEWRMLWYQFGPYEAYYNVGRYGDVLALADATLNSTSRGLGLEESHYWRGMTYAAQGKLKESENEFGVAIEWNPNYYPAKEQLTLVESGSFKPPVTGQ